MHPDAIALYARVGRLIRVYRERRQMTQLRLGELLEVPEATISRIERGHARLRHGRLSEIAHVLGVPVAELYDGANTGSPLQGE